MIITRVVSHATDSPFVYRPKATAKSGMQIRKQLGYFQLTLTQIDVGQHCNFEKSITTWKLSGLPISMTPALHLHRMTAALLRRI